MCRRIIAAVMAVLLILLTFGCGKGTNDVPKTNDTAENGKIAVILGAREQAPEVYAAASEIAKAHPESVMLIKYAENFYVDYTAVANVAKSVAGDSSVKAILFADGVKGTGAAVKAVREMRDDICIAVCNPHEGSAETRGADLMISVDFPSLGAAMVKQAKAMGAEHFVFYTTERHLTYSSVVGLRTAAEAACETEGLTFKAAGSIDRYEAGRTLDAAKKYLHEDLPRRAETFGKKTALVCTEPQVQGALASETIGYGMVMPATFMPSPISLAADLGVDMTGHETDSAYALDQLRSDGIGASGRVATWGFSVYAAFLQTAYDYAAGVLNGSGTETSVEDVQNMLAHHTAGAEATVTTDANGAYLVQSELITV